MNEELLLSNYLMLLKSTIEVYIHGTIESSNEEVRKILHDGLEETLSHQERTYEEMVNNEWYVIDNVNPEYIKNIINEL